MIWTKEDDDMARMTLDVGIGSIGTPNEPNDPFYGHLCLNGVMKPLTLACCYGVMNIPCLSLLFENDFEDTLKLLY